ncbi:DUF1127 domain-containing protein [Metapseudomonas furukawaii]|nr:DUF1127 domain-containing protein [Pseudomonas furukawaii]WAG81252.1 DUF1127 domain-containing protein [Pseudomonas furukawaii]
MMKRQRGFIGTLQQPRFENPSSRERWLTGIWMQIRRWEQLARERKQLASMSDDMLKDIGLNRVDAVTESERPFWDDPLRK